MVIYELVLGMKVKPCIDPQDGGQGSILISLGFMSGIVMIYKEVKCYKVAQSTNRTYSLKITRRDDYSLEITRQDDYSLE